MPYKTQIAALTVSSLPLRLKIPFGISSGSLPEAANLLVTMAKPRPV